MIVGILGCGNIANLIVKDIDSLKDGIEIKYFYDNDMERAEALAHSVSGVTVLNIEDMLDKVDLVLEAASPDSVRENASKILSSGTSMIIMSVGALMDEDFRQELIGIAKENNADIHLPSGAVVGLDGIKAVANRNLQNVRLITRKSPKSLGKDIDSEEVLFEGKASEAVKEFPFNINVAATISLACNMDIDVKVVVDPNVDRNVHEVIAVGDFGEFKVRTKNLPCSANPKTSMLAALSAIKLLKSLNSNLHIGT